ncbi:MAG: YggT family protein [Micrococcales bacterium]|nr:YggT family protein [Microbacteriaceae bacterium]NBR22348.1 YggT family protein [Micrococcales bacterium]NBX94474.1 YggT family protein [Actinomycetota bacterium]NBR77210.1 YggT family protein [Microbacteriaceae bacterium]NBS60592.1 YggT family protein [Microbacteriaceae bacterium]
MSLLIQGLLWFIEIFRLVLFVRIIIDLIRTMNPNFRPKGIFLVLIEICYTLTDWVIRPLSRLIKPVRIGGGYLDLSILAIFVLLYLAERLLASLL